LALVEIGDRKWDPAGFRFVQSFRRRIGIPIELREEPPLSFFFGLVVGFEPELGYFSLNELKTAKEGLKGIRALPIERDIHFQAQRLSEVKRRHHIS